jgi:MFS superfamily sulfate permease-like transporter
VNLIAKDPLQRKIEIVNWIILTIIFIPSLIFGTFKFALGVLLGGFISILNFYWMKRSLSRVFEKLSGNVKGAVVFKYFIRLTLTAIILYFLISSDIVNIIGLVIGLSVVVITIVVTVITTLYKKNFLEEVI